MDLSKIDNIVFDALIPKEVLDAQKEHIANGKLMSLAPELLKVCQNALKDVKAMNEWMVEKGHHGYTLLEQDLQEVLEKTKT